VIRWTAGPASQAEAGSDESALADPRRLQRICAGRGGAGVTELNGKVGKSDQIGAKRGPGGFDRQRMIEQTLEIVRLSKGDASLV
jgi:hypothetical protein